MANAGETFSEGASISSTSVAVSSVKILAKNPSRKGVIVLNNDDTNALYIALGHHADISSQVTYRIAPLSQWVMTVAIYTGNIFAIRSAGSGTAFVTELT